ncbi:phage integrase SAM-like domain-containing protein [Pedobacter gandavensis]|uniref:Phage integrase SAM-like domain-containing protein n=1 Tax=Pedobacter gandavensis TaxID=2679963 RepID=A0ABR6EUD9_9SPHI|nr:hypothetical protein [Pedobacter gandavensis]
MGGLWFSKGTAKRYRTSLKHTLDFLQWKYNISDIDIRKVDHAFIHGYDFYLRSVRKCANNSNPIRYGISPQLTLSRSDRRHPYLIWRKIITAISTKLDTSHQMG